MSKIIVIFISIVFLIALGVFFAYKQNFFSSSFTSNILGTYAPVEYTAGPMALETINAKLISQDEHSLSFSTSGIIESISALEGSFTETETTLLKIETRELELELKKNEALLSQTEANLAKLRKGTRFEEINLYATKKKSAETSLKNQKQTVIDTAYTAFIQADDAIRNRTDIFFTSPKTVPTLIFTPSDLSLKTTLEAKRLSLEKMLRDWKDDVEKMKTSGDMQKYITITRNNLDDTTSFLDQMALAVNELTAGSFTQDTIDIWRNSVSTARTNISTALLTIGAVETEYKGANRNLSVTQNELDIKVAGTHSDDILMAIDAVEASKNQVDIIKEHIRQATLFASESGLLIKKIYPKEGEYVAGGSPVIVLADKTLEIQVDIPQEDINMVAIGNKALLSLSSLPKESITGIVTSIDHLEIEKEGSVYFRVHITLDQIWSNSVLLRPGMTGNILIFSDIQGNSLRIPLSALLMKEDEAYVKALRPSGKVEELKIKIGAKDARFVQVLTGISIGDQVLIKP